MGNIYYLMGAGASAKNNVNDNVQMPLADNFHEAIAHNCKYESPIFHGQNGDDIKRILNGIEDFSKTISKFNTIDEAMRKLYLNKELETLREYKNYISIVFYILERLYKYKDTRYEQFLLTLIKDDFTLPNNLNIISWNYDNQFEIAADQIYNNSQNLKTLKFPEKLFKINGTAEWYPNYDEFNNSTENIVSEQRRFNPEYHIENIEKIRLNKESSIKFAWESNLMNEKLLEKDVKNYIEKIEKGTSNVLVVIGYSFPFVNHQFDLMLLNAINPNRIYYQNPRVDDNFLRDFSERFGLYNFIQTQSLIHIKGASRFYIPPEMHEL